MTFSYENKKGFKKVTIIGFKKGSIIVDFQVVFALTAEVNKTDIVHILNDTIARNNGTIGSFKVTENSIIVTKVEFQRAVTEEPTTTAAPVTPQADKTIFHIMIAGVALAGIILLLLIILLVMIVKSRGPKAHSFSGSEIYNSQIY